ncbi:MAG: PDZ domain-containing protein [Acidobacteria bacterium]|nr:PDZ domain-containing protein [Acidobacteriota bacterium]
MNLSSKKKSYCLLLVILFLCSITYVIPIGAQQNAQQNLGPYDRDRGKAILSTLKEDIKKNYYDSSFKGVDLDAKFKTAEERVKQANSTGQIFSIIAQTLMDLNDSHTFFLPPSRTSKVEYGWQIQMIGNKCFVVAVKPNSDADKKGLKAGDEVLTINGFTPSRQDLWKIQYAYNVLRPQTSMRFNLKKPDGKESEIDVNAKITQGKVVKDLTDGEGSDILDMIREQENSSQANRHQFLQLDDIVIWKMPRFDLSEEEVNKAMDIVKKSKSLIIDLRSNPGGLVDMLKHLSGYFFEKDIKIGTLKGRKDSKDLIAKSQGKKVYNGKVVVLVDSKSASCSEVFSRLIQIEKRGTVIGDNTSGAVMISRRHRHQLGMDIVIFYGASVTELDLIMTDGKSLEHTGVVPDELLLPSANDLSLEKDPIMVRAVEILGKSISAEKAGTFFPIEWEK